MSAHRITLTIPLETRWLPLAESAALQFAAQFDFPRPAQNALASSLNEAGEELIRLLDETGRSGTAAFTFDYEAPAFQVDIAYDGKIPLNPHLTEEYEVPDVNADMDSRDLEALWLHLIKKRMDRVFFLVQDGRHVLRLVKYRRREGGERRPWSFSLSPALKAGLNVEWTEKEGRLEGVQLQRLDSGKVLRFGPLEALAIRAMNGRSTLYDAYLECVEVLGPFSPQRLTVLFELLESSGMLASQAAEKPESGWRKVLRRLFNPVFSIPRADALVEAAFRLTRPLTGWIGLLLCLTVGLSGLVPLLQRHPFQPAALAAMESAFRQRPGVFLLSLAPLLLIMMAVHELAHGLVCKRFGGRVPRLGMMVYLGAFLFFCDTTASLNFPRRWQRVMVSLAGPLTTFAFLGAGLWATDCPAGPSLFWTPVWTMFSLACFFSLVWNFNPFIRMDAYYMLLDLTGLAKLRERSFRFILYRLTGRPAPGEGVGNRPPGRKEKITFWLYGLSGAVATTLLFLWPLIFCIRGLASGSPDQGLAFLVAVAVVLTLLSLGRAASARLSASRHRKYELK